MGTLFGASILNTCIFGWYIWFYLSHKNDAYLRKRNTFITVTLGTVAFLTWTLSLLYIQCDLRHRLIIIALTPLCLVVSWSILHVLLLRFPQVCIALILKMASINPSNRNKEWFSAELTAKKVRKVLLINFVGIDVIWVLGSVSMFYVYWYIHST